MDVLESDSEEDVTPGPGQYHNAQNSTFHKQSKPQRLQFFGSTVERFNDQALPKTPN